MNNVLVKCRKCGADFEGQGKQTLCPPCAHQSHQVNLKVDSTKIINTVKRNPCATLQQVADKYGLSRERVRQIITKANVPKINRNYRIVKHVCLSCSKPINNTNKKFCNKTCWHEYSHPLIECSNCHKLIRKRASDILSIQTHTLKRKEHIFCSRLCRDTYWGKHAALEYGFHSYPEHAGRKHKWDYNQIHNLRISGLTHYQISRELGVPISSVGYIIKHELGT